MDLTELPHIHLVPIYVDALHYHHFYDPKGHSLKKKSAGHCGGRGKNHFIDYKYIFHHNYTQVYVVLGGLSEFIIQGKQRKKMININPSTKYARSIYSSILKLKSYVL